MSTEVGGISHAVEGQFVGPFIAFVPYMGSDFKDGQVYVSSGHVSIRRRSMGTSSGWADGILRS